MKKIFFIGFIFSCLLSSYKSKAQLLQPGDAVVSMSGTIWSNNPTSDPNYVLEIFKTRNTASAPIGLAWVMSTTSYNAYSFKHPDWIRSKMGNIFGLTIDNNRNIYATATGFYGTQVSPFSTGQIWRIDGITGAVTAFKDLHTGGQNQACLGNIKFFNGYLYVSNLADGKIYVIDVANPATNLAPFDPGGSADSRKPHGLAIRNEPGNARLYFSVNEFNSTTTQIRSIGISGSAFVGTETVEISNFTTKPYPITDIAFSQDNSRMIFTERFTNSWLTTVYAHDCDVYEYSFIGGSWTNLNPSYKIGTYLDPGKPYPKNSAGGLSFSKFIIGKNGETGCDTTIWATSDAIFYPSPSCYGFTGFKHSPGSGGSYNGVNIDFDNNLSESGSDKRYLGDVEVCDTTLDCSNCKCGEWGNGAPRPYGTGYPLSLTIPQAGGYSMGYLAACGSSYSFIKGQVTGTLNANYSCIGNCDKVINWQLMNTTTNAPVGNGNMNNGAINLSQFNNLACGTYKFIFTPKCGNNTCSTCEYFINIVCDPPPCCPQQTQISIKPQNASYSSSNNVNGWGTYNQSYTINSNVPMSEIRINVEHFELNSTDPDCISCTNMPKTWGSLLGAAYNGNGFVKPINTLPFTTSAYADGRELDYKPGYLISINNGTVNVSVGMPNVSPIDCCLLTANLCLKFTFKDANCRECTYFYCNQNIEIKKTANENPNGTQLNNVNKTVQKSLF